MRRKTVDGRRTAAIEPDIVVDATGLYCPIPVLRLEKTLRDRPRGSVVMLKATDPAARADVEVFCREESHRLLETTREGEILRFLVRKGL